MQAKTKTERAINFTQWKVVLWARFGNVCIDGIELQYLYVK